VKADKRKVIVIFTVPTTPISRCMYS